MKKLHLINAKTLADIETKQQKKVLPLLETETLEWAKKFRADAYKVTAEVQAEFEKNPSSTNAKYFRYLRRLLELKLEFLDAEILKDPKKDKKEISKEIRQFLNVESLNVPEYISCSQIGAYENCPIKWYYRYALGIHMPKTAALHYGTAVDESLNVYFDEKVKGIIVPRSAVHASFYEHFEKGRAEVNWGDVNPDSLVKTGPAVINAYLDNFDNITKPKEIQAEAIIHFDGGYLKGYLDILEENAVVDTKTAAKFWEDKGRYAKHLQELQPKAYSLWFLEEYGKIPEFRYQIVTKDVDENGNAKPQTQLIKFEVKKYELEAFRLRVQKIWDEIQAALKKGKAGFKAQADPSSRGSEVGFGFGKDKPSPLCSKMYCEYAQLCVNSGLRISDRYDKATKKHIYEDDKNGTNKAKDLTANSGSA